MNRLDGALLGGAERHSVSLNPARFVGSYEAERTAALPLERSSQRVGCPHERLPPAASAVLNTTMPTKGRGVLPR